jgi:hypothetical protein
MSLRSEPVVVPRLGRRKRLVFAAAVALIALTIPTITLIAVDLYLHGKYAKTAGFNAWGYRGPIAGRKRAGEYRVAVLGGSSAFGYGVKWDEAIPALLEAALKKQGTRPFTVVNLAYNNEGAYSMKFTLQDYAYLDYDLVCLYEGYNDVISPSFSVFRHDSPVFRLTGYLPIFPMVFKEKAAAMLHGGDAGALYRDSGKTVFSASIAERAAAGVLDATAAVGQSLERQLDRVSREPPRALAAGNETGCAYPWEPYCRAMLNAVEYAVGAGKQVLVITQPYELGAELRARHQGQQRELASLLTRKFGGDRRVRYVNLGDVVDLGDPALSFDRMHLTAAGNRLIADALVEPVRAMAAANAR